MKSKSLKNVSLLLVFCILISLAAINPVKAIQTDKINNMITIAENELGYLETTYDDGSFYSKYGDWYGYPNGAWCAMFVSWCANQANISTNVIPKFASCSEGRKWFVNKGLWKNKGEYEPKTGDLIFFNNCSHVGIVKKFYDDIVYTIEGNAADENGENYGVRERHYAITSSKITGYGIPDTEITSNFNGSANKKATAYMLPDSNSATVWEVWENDDLEILCEENGYYLVMYPFLSTGKFVSAYIKKDVANVSGIIPNTSECYNINKKAVCTTSASLYHNASDDALLSSNGTDKKIRATLSANTGVTVLFEKDGFYFVRNASVSGFIKKDNIKFTENSNNKIGDINGDGIISVVDVTYLQGYIANKSSFNTVTTTVDLNGDNYIDINDVSLIQMYISGYITKFPIEKEPITTQPTETVVPTTQAIDVASIIVHNTSIYLNEQKQIEYQVLPENATEKTIYWISNDDEIVSVDSNGIMTGNSIGTVKITAISKNGVKASFSVTVTNRNVDVSKIEIDNKYPAVMNNGATLQLNATVSPANATDKRIVWSSSNSDVASVNQNGLVTANNAGTAIITAKSSNGSIYSTSTIRVNRTTTYLESGTYCLKLKGTSSYLDHQGGNTNGTNVHLWSGDGNSNNNQKIVIDRIDDNRYMLRSATSNNLLIDVNRGSSYSDPIAIGKNIDLWQNNDWEAQEWLFTKTYDGYYIIRLNMYQNGAIEAGGKDNGANIFFGTYNSENDMQKWELVKTPDPDILETTMWVCNTGDVGNVNVRSGPGTNYASIGGFNEGQQVTIIGSTSSEWLKVRGANRHGGGTIEGYSHRDYYTINPPVTPPSPDTSLDAKFRELQTRFVNGQYWNKYNDPSCNRTGTIPCKCSLYCSPNCSCKCGAFTLNGAFIAGQCHGYALKLAYEIYGSNANTWRRTTSLNDLTPGDIIRYSGHSVMVTGVSGNLVTYTDCNGSGPCRVRWGATKYKGDFKNIETVYKHP
ncbi:Ig-like domain-containing protein [Ruminococcus sp.]|uniref:Ig-like domain-containing protein n=1 Tax=Ruminococcus sp. TaxID=41978 RepID=UPI003864A749